MNRSQNDYYFRGLLGSGAQGKVYKAVRKSDRKLLALKIIPTANERAVEKAQKEVNFLKKLTPCHPFVVCYYDSFYDERAKEFVVEMEYIEGQDLFDFIVERIEVIDPENLYKYLLLIAKDVARGLEFIHSKGIIHQDIKPENIMVNQDYIPKIIDFGLSCQMIRIDVGPRQLKGLCEEYVGTPAYIPPELIINKVRYPVSDIWSLGVSLYVLAVKQYPWRIAGPDMPEVTLQIIRDNPPKKLNTSNNLLNNIVNRMLERDPLRRVTASQIVELLKNVGETPTEEFKEQVNVAEMKEAEEELEFVTPTKN